MIFCIHQEDASIQLYSVLPTNKHYKLILTNLKTNDVVILWGEGKLSISQKMIVNPELCDFLGELRYYNRHQENAFQKRVPSG